MRSVHAASYELPKALFSALRRCLAILCLTEPNLESTFTERTK